MSLKLYLSFGTIAFVVLLILQPYHIVTPPFPYFDKVAHFIISGMVFLALTNFVSIRKSVLLAILILTLGEFLQLYIPTRGATISDSLCNIGGVLGFWFLYTNAWLTNKLKSIKLLSS